MSIELTLAIVLGAVAFIFYICCTVTDYDSKGDLFLSYEKMESAALDENASIDTIISCVANMLELLTKFQTGNDDQRKDISAYTAHLQAIAKMDNVSDIQIIMENYSLPYWMVIYPKEKRFNKLNFFLKVMAILAAIGAVVCLTIHLVNVANDYDLYRNYFNQHINDHFYEYRFNWDDFNWNSYDSWY